MGERRRWGGLSLRLRLTLVTAGLLAVGLSLGAVALTSVVSASRVAALDEVAAERAATVSRLAADDRLPDPLPVAEAVGPERPASPSRCGAGVSRGWTRRR